MPTVQWLQSDENVRTAAAGFYSDFHAFDLESMTWFNLTKYVIGTAPTARLAHGFTSSGGKLYVHGGNNDLSQLSIHPKLGHMHSDGHMHSATCTYALGHMRVALLSTRGVILRHAKDTPLDTINARGGGHMHSSCSRGPAQPSRVRLVAQPSRVRLVAQPPGHPRWQIAESSLQPPDGIPSEIPACSLQHPPTLAVTIVRVTASTCLLSPSAESLDDLHAFDPATMTWTLLSPSADSAPPPSARLGHGFTATGGKLYVHGGVGITLGNQSVAGESVAAGESGGESLLRAWDLLRVCEARLQALSVGPFFTAQRGVPRRKNQRA